jgi:hypothetical protein
MIADALDKKVTTALREIVENVEPSPGTRQAILRAAADSLQQAVDWSADDRLASHLSSAHRREMEAGRAISSESELLGVLQARLIRVTCVV